MSKIIIANWKMHSNPHHAKEWVDATAEYMQEKESAHQVILCPPAPLLGQMKQNIAGTPIKLGAQDCHEQQEGPFTGDTSPALLKAVGCDYVLLGHSERRQGHGENNRDISRKASAALKAELTPIICIGETLDDRGQGHAEDVVAEQLRESLPQAYENPIIAYEPVWAIGTGKTPTLEEIANMHKHIVSLGKAGITVLYGGSVKPENAKEILSLEEVGGALVGGASLKAESFNAIIDAV